MAQLKLILLDFDGTLVDTRRANAEAYIATLSESGIGLTIEEYLDRYFGVRCMEFMRMVGIEDESMIKRLRQRKVELYPRYFDSITLNKPLWEWCQMLRRTGIKVWIVSTGHIDNIRNVINHLKLDYGIDGIISGDDVLQPKPSPECFIKAMNIVGAQPNETIIFEDSYVGIEAAKASGAEYVRIEMQ